MHQYQQTSLQAYEDIQPELGKRRQEVYSALSEIREATNTMLSRFTGLPINQITPRIHELRQLGLVLYSKTDLCPITKKRVLWWRCKEKW